jgi:hypothetical protein
MAKSMRCLPRPGINGSTRPSERECAVGARLVVFPAKIIYSQPCLSITESTRQEAISRHVRVVDTMARRTP